MQYKVITAEIHTRTALHVGSGAGNETTDALIRRDAAGNPIIPGTALAGVLRSLLTRLTPRIDGSVCNALKNQDETCHCAVCRLMGALNPSDEGDNARASRLLVFNATLRKAGNEKNEDNKKDEAQNQNSASHIRDGVGIDRATGAAARVGRVKFDLETLSAGAIFDFRLELREVPKQNKELETILAAGLAEWQAGRAWVGGRVNRGMGAFKLESPVFKTLDLDDPKNLVAFLGDDKPWETLAKTAKGETWPTDQAKAIAIHPLLGNRDLAPHVAQTWVKITGTLRAAGPLLTNDTVSSTLTGFDHAPLLAQWGRWQHPVLGGAGLRGVIRSHAERIARTIATHHAESKDDFLRICPACNPVESRKEAALANCDSLLKENGVSNNAEVNDQQLCLACLLFGSSRRGSRLVVEDAPYNAKVAGEKPKLKMFDFLAVDRFTGGGAEGFKFDALALWQPAFTLNLYLENPAPWELGWLVLVLRDMQAGWLNVGMGAAKGFGRMELQDDLLLTLGYLHADDLAAFELDADGQRDGLYTEKTFSLSEAAGWVTQFNEKIKGNAKKGIAEFSRGDEEHQLPKLPADTYFNGTVDKLYPREVTL
ncbi:MAG: RAMP superfamily CRISPR-associated protein [Anaerolineales bacterium]